VPWEGVVGLVSSHHDPSKYRSEGYKPLKTIVCADWLSSGERRELEDEGEEGNRRETPLKSIFSEIDIGKGKSASAQYYPIKKLELDKDVIFPKPLEGKGGKDRLKADYAGLWGDFVEEVDGIKAITDFDAYFNTLYHLLQKYTWCVPSAVWRDVLPSPTCYFPGCYVYWLDKALFDQLTARRYDRPCDICPDEIRKECETY